MRYSIAYVIPYFGQFNNYFQLWLDSCGRNPTIDFLIFTDDKRDFDYPSNVHVSYVAWEEMKNRIQALYDFELALQRPYRLCDFKVAYGEIFEEELKNYDYWGYCDVDLIWGDIRAFMTDDILENYDRIGFMGHSSLYKNTKKLNSSYKLDWNGELFYKKAFGEDKTHFFDEWGTICILKNHGFKIYQDIIFANPSNLYWHFYLCYYSNKEDYKNNKQAFVWKDGKIFRIYVEKNGEKVVQEYMYIHLISRLMTEETIEKDGNSIVIVPSKFIKMNLNSVDDLSVDFLKQNNKKSIIKYLLWWKEREKTWRGVFKYIKGTLRPRYRILFYNSDKL
jgi:hypothetical protein